MKRLGILLSGRGSNFEAIANSVDEGRIDAEIAVVISNKPSALGLERARKRGIPAVCIPSQGLQREEYDLKVVSLLKEKKVDLVCLAGFMRLVSAQFVNEFRHRILNVHPSLLPSFPGLEGQKQALDYGVTFTGCTVHFVNEHLDAGPIIKQAVVPVRDDDTEDSLSARILEEEHRIYTEAINLVLSGEFQVIGRRVLSQK